MTLFSSIVLRASALLLPAPLRQEWVDEWTGEIAAAPAAATLGSLLTEIRLLPGVVTDAAATRRFLREISNARQDTRIERGGMMAAGMTGIWNDFRHGARGLRARPGFALVAIVTLGLGVGATTAMFSAVHSVLLRELPYGNADRIVVLRQVDTRDGSLQRGISAANLHDVVMSARTIGHVAMADGVHGLRLVQNGRAESLRAWVVSEGYFKALGTQAALGRTFLPGEYVLGREQVVVLGHSAWQSRFGGDATILGRELILDDVAHIVVGVLPPDFKYPSAPDAWTPRPRQPRDDDFRGMATGKGVARLLPGVTIEQAQRELDRIARNLSRSYPDTNANTGFRLVSLRQDLLGDVESPLTILLGAVGLVLLIASANVAGLQLARGASRSREYALRGALGATAPQVLRLVSAESLLLAGAGGTLGVAFAYLGVGLIQLLGPSHLPRIEELRIDWTVLGFALVAALGSALVAGIAPAARASRADLNAALSDSSRGSTRGTRINGLHDRLVVGEIALALVLVIGAGLLLRSFDRLLDNGLGFDPEGLLAAQVWAYDDHHTAKFDYFEQGAEALRAIPGVESVGITSDLPLADDQMLLARTLVVPFAIDDRTTPPTGSQPVASLSAIDRYYHTSLRIRLVEGRAFSTTDGRRSAPVLMINEAFARRYFPDQDPIGQRLSLEFRAPRSWEIVGVLADVRRQGLESEPRAEMYVPLSQEPLNGLTFVIRTATDPAALAPAVREALWAADPTQAIWASRPVTDMLSDWTRQRRFNAALLAAFAALALALAAIGVYGLMAFSVEQRVNEFGIRRALGGDTSAILKTVLRKGLILALIGVTLGLVGALALGQVIRGMLFGVGPFDPMTFLVLAGLVVVVAIVAALLPAHRATRVDPMVALTRGE